MREHKLFEIFVEGTKKEDVIIYPAKSILLSKIAKKDIYIDDNFVSVMRIINYTDTLNLSDSDKNTFLSVAFSYLFAVLIKAYTIREHIKIELQKFKDIIANSYFAEVADFVDLQREFCDLIQQKKYTEHKHLKFFIKNKREYTSVFSYIEDSLDFFKTLKFDKYFSKKDKVEFFGFKLFEKDTFEIDDIVAFSIDSLNINISINIITKDDLNRENINDYFFKMQDGKGFLGYAIERLKDSEQEDMINKYSTLSFAFCELDSSEIEAEYPERIKEIAQKEDSNKIENYIFA